MTRILTVVMVSLILLAAASMSGDEPQKSGDQVLAVYELMVKQDSVFANVNTGYKIIKPILQRSCFDCHSDSTDYPWYHKLPIIKGIIDGHVTEGIEHLDMSNDFPFDGKEPPLKLLEEIKEEIEEGKMPISSYRLLHWGTLIEGETRDSVFLWIDSATTALTDFYERYGVDSDAETPDEN